jgi:hypothetical protein
VEAPSIFHQPCRLPSEILPAHGDPTAVIALLCNKGQANSPLRVRTAGSAGNLRHSTRGLHYMPVITVNGNGTAKCSGTALKPAPWCDDSIPSRSFFPARWNVKGVAVSSNPRHAVALPCHKLLCLI